MGVRSGKSGQTMKVEETGSADHLLACGAERREKSEVSI